MRHVLVLIVLALGCSRESESRPPAPPLTPEQVRVRVDKSPGVVAGVVTSRGFQEVKLESGGPNPIPLRLDAKTQVTLDGQPAQASDIREGHLVRAAYKMTSEGEPLAIKVIANSRPVTK
jgi:hypothetical protein